MNTKTELRTYLEHEIPVTGKALQELTALFITETYAKGDVVIHEGILETRFRFLNTGVLREYYATPEKETNINFYTTPQFVSDFASLINNVPTHKNLECITPVTMFSANRMEFKAIMDAYGHCTGFENSAFKKLLNIKNNQEYYRTTKSAEELYMEIAQLKPDWLQLVPQYHIASYLGVTPETLSRIRKRIS